MTSRLLVIFPENLQPQSARSHIDLSLGRLPDKSWKCCPGRPHKRWSEQFCDDNHRPSADVWTDAIRRGHSCSNATVLNDDEDNDGSV